MARQLYANQRPASGGELLATVNAHADGHAIPNSGKTVIIIYNGSGSSVTATFTTPGTVDGLAIADKTAAIPAGERWVFGEFDPKVYNQADGCIYLGFSATTSVTVAALDA